MNKRYAILYISSIILFIVFSIGVLSVFGVIGFVSDQFYKYINQDTRGAVAGEHIVRMAADTDITINLSARQQTILGSGGNVYSPESSSLNTYYDNVLDDFPVNYARIRSRFYNWEIAGSGQTGGLTSGGDNIDSNNINWTYFNNYYNAESDEIKGLKKFKERGIISIYPIWEFACWLAERNPQSKCRENAPWSEIKYNINLADFGELAESLASYFKFIKNKFGINVDYFSVNEPEMGIFIPLSSENNKLAKFYEAVGDRFVSEGLSTKMMAPDTGELERGFADNLDAIMNYLQSVGKTNYVGAFSYHAYDVGANVKYNQFDIFRRRLDDGKSKVQAWRNTLGRQNIPLVVAEYFTDSDLYYANGAPNKILEPRNGVDMSIMALGLYDLGGANVIMPWTVLGCVDCGQIVDTNGNPYPVYNYLSLINQFTPSGTTVVHVDNYNFDTYAGAFIDPFGKIAVAIVAKSGQTINLNILGAGTGLWKRYETIGGQAARKADVNISNGAVSFVVPDNSLTIIYNGEFISVCDNNGVCDSGSGETALNCQADCGAQPYCGDGLCNGSETSASCAADCGGGGGDCSSKSGHICSTTQTCPVNFINALNSTRCCPQDCVNPPSNTCTSHGGSTCATRQYCNATYYLTVSDNNTCCPQGQCMDKVADLNCDGSVDFRDLTILIAYWGSFNANQYKSTDFYKNCGENENYMPDLYKDQDNEVNFRDFSLFLGQWGR